jgi:hypothetical protein
MEMQLNGMIKTPCCRCLVVDRVADDAKLSCYLSASAADRVVARVLFWDAPALDGWSEDGQVVPSL